MVCWWRNCDAVSERECKNCGERFCLEHLSRGRHDCLLSRAFGEVTK